MMIKMLDSKIQFYSPTAERLDHAGNGDGNVSARELAGASLGELKTIKADFDRASAANAFYKDSDDLRDDRWVLGMTFAGAPLGPIGMVAGGLIGFAVAELKRDKGKERADDKADVQRIGNALNTLIAARLAR